MPWEPTVTPGKPCAKCGSTVKKRNGYNENTGTVRWTCQPCHRQRKRGQIRNPLRRRSAECRCSDRIGDDPWCIEHEDVPLAV